MQPEFHLQLHRGVRVTADGDDLLIARDDGKALRHRAPGVAARTLLDALANAGGRAESLVTLAQAAEPSVEAASLYFLLTSLEQRGLLSYTLCEDEQPLATLEPMTAAFRLSTLDTAAAGYRMSRFAWLRREGDSMLVESSLGQARLVLMDERIGMLVSFLTNAQSMTTLETALPGISPASLTGLLVLLANAQAVFPCDEQGQLPEDEDPVLRQWDYHDLLFHTRSRMGRHDYPLGATFRFANQLPHAPAVKPASGAPRLALPQPNAEHPAPDFFAVIEARRSIRDYGESPLTFAQLGTLLWHCARAQSHRPANPDDPTQYEAIVRPVSSAGAMQELELYLTVTRCDGLEPALYRYDPLTHELEWVAAPNAAIQSLVQDAMNAAGLKTPPDVLITLAARFERMAWKYQSIAYALTLKNVGVLYQQFYLVATALNLAPCALGAGNSERFAAAAGTNYYAETSVGEFALATRAD